MLPAKLGKNHTIRKKHTLVHIRCNIRITAWKQTHNLQINSPIS